MGTLRRNVTTAASLLVLFVSFTACGGGSAPPAVDGDLHATAMLIDERVRADAAAGGHAIGRVADIEARFAHLVARNVIPATYRFAYADVDNDGVVDDRRLEISGDDGTLCWQFGPYADTTGRASSGSCPGELPFTGPTTVPVGSAPAAPSGPAAPPTSARPRLPGGAGKVAERADQAAADVLARQLGDAALLLARLDGAPPASIAVLEQVAADVPDGAVFDYRDRDGDGLADGGKVSVVPAAGVGACLTFDGGGFTVAAGVC